MDTSRLTGNTDLGYMSRYTRRGTLSALWDVAYSTVFHRGQRYIHHGCLFMGEVSDLVFCILVSFFD